MTMKSLVEMARKNSRIGHRGPRGDDNSISYAVHKQTPSKKYKSVKPLWRVCIRVGTDLWERARLRFGDPIDFQIDFTDGEGVLSRVQDTNGKRYPKFYKMAGAKSKNFTGGIVFNYVEGMPFIRGVQKLSNVEIENGHIYFEFTTRQLEKLNSF